MNEKSLVITGIISPLIALIPTLILVWKNYEKQKSPLAIRIIRKKAQIAKTELENQAKMEKLKLELKTLEEEAHYQERMSKWESGEVQTNELEQSVDNLSNLSQQVSELKEKGEQIIQKKSWRS
ncbi:MAG: hypothetical protein MRERC_4c080 [Mycoplasmataceae bacterium RC_NB112A]|nr:MAG: hypothetical protein MRERC_4c080 [Mycoplasmataceae bacterium RC_NB112A]